MEKITRQGLRKCGLKKKARLEAEQMLFSAPSRTSKYRKIYNNDFHPFDLIDFFKARLDELEENDIERVINGRGDVSYVQKPVRLPTLSGYAIHAGVIRETLYEWSLLHEDFGEAYQLAKAYQEEILIQVGTSGGYERSLSIFILKNLQGWQDRIEQTHKGGVTLNFDAEDAKA